MDLGKWVVGFVLIAMFSLSLIGFAVNFASDNNSAIDISDDSQITSLATNLNSNLSGFGTGSESSTASIINSSVATGSQTTQTGSQFAITPTNAIGIGRNIILVGFYKLFGGSSNFNVFLYAFLGILTFITGLVIWKAWIGRQPID